MSHRNLNSPDWLSSERKLPSTTADVVRSHLHTSFPQKVALRNTFDEHYAPGRDFCTYWKPMSIFWI